MSVLGRKETSCSMVIFRSVSIVKSNHTLDVIGKHGNHETIDALDMLPTRISENGMVAIAAINKVASSEHILSRLPEKNTVW